MENPFSMILASTGGVAATARGRSDSVARTGENSAAAANLPPSRSTDALSSLAGSGDTPSKSGSSGNGSSISVAQQQQQSAKKLSRPSSFRLADSPAPKTPQKLAGASSSMSRCRSSSKEVKPPALGQLLGTATIPPSGHRPAGAAAAAAASAAAVKTLDKALAAKNSVHGNHAQPQPQAQAQAQAPAAATSNSNSASATTSASASAITGAKPAAKAALLAKQRDAVRKIRTRKDSFGTFSAPEAASEAEVDGAKRRQSSAIANEIRTLVRRAEEEQQQQQQGEGEGEDEDEEGGEGERGGEGENGGDSEGEGEGEGEGLVMGEAEALAALPEPAAAQSPSQSPVPPMPPSPTAVTSASKSTSTSTSTYNKSRPSSSGRRSSSSSSSSNAASTNSRKRESLALDSALISRMLPRRVCQHVRAGKPVPPEFYPNVAIFFSDVVGFTDISAAVEPIRVMRLLNTLFTVMDYVTSLFPLYKVETIGDAYMVASGLALSEPTHSSSGSSSSSQPAQSPAQAQQQQHQQQPQTQGQDQNQAEADQQQPQAHNQSHEQTQKQEQEQAQHSQNPAQVLADFAILVSHAVSAVPSPLDGSPIRIRMGLHCGDVMAGVVGSMMPRYCLFGDTVNTASRMESNGEPGRIHISEAMAMQLQAGAGAGAGAGGRGRHRLSERGVIEVKGKGSMRTFWLLGADEGEEGQGGGDGEGQDQEQGQGEGEEQEGKEETKARATSRPGYGPGPHPAGAEAIRSVVEHSRQLVASSFDFGMD